MEITYRNYWNRTSTKRFTAVCATTTPSSGQSNNIDKSLSSLVKKIDNSILRV